MKNLERLFSLLVMCSAVIFAGCQNKNDKPSGEQPMMAVTYASLDGAWMLDSWNHEPLMEGTCCYVEFNRSEQRFTMWDNMGSMYVRQTTGSFRIEQDEYKRYILSGRYDNGVGDWSSEYIVSMPQPGDEMIWQATNNNDVATYRRIESIPEL